MLNGWIVSFWRKTWHSIRITLTTRLWTSAFRLKKKIDKINLQWRCSLGCIECWLEVWTMKLDWSCWQLTHIVLNISIKISQRTPTRHVWITKSSSSFTLTKSHTFSIVNDNNLWWMGCKWTLTTHKMIFESICVQHNLML